VDKAIGKEHKTASKLSAAEHKHNIALQSVTAAEKEVELKKRQKADLATDLERKRASFDEFHRKKESHDVRGPAHTSDISRG
jgi:molecular chaperone GrpE (heat shock protein)